MLTSTYHEFYIEIGKIEEEEEFKVFFVSHVSFSVLIMYMCKFFFARTCQRNHISHGNIS